MGLLTGLLAFEVLDFLNSFTGNRVGRILLPYAICHKANHVSGLYSYATQMTNSS